jgi:ribonuclease P protein component
LAPRPDGFPKRARLLKRSDFDRVFARPQRSADDCFTVLARPNGLGLARLGLAIARKHAARATQRNRIKRLVRERFRHHRHALEDLDFIVLGRHGIGKRDNDEIRASLDRHWKRLIAQCRPSS